MSLLTRLSRRYLARHPWLAGLSILGVALGVALVVSIDLANQSARSAFLLSAQSITGKATHQLTPSGQGIPESFYTNAKAKRLLGYKPAHSWRDYVAP